MTTDPDPERQSGRRVLSSVIRNAGTLSPRLSVAIGVAVASAVADLRHQGWSPARLNAGRVQLRDEGTAVQVEIDDAGRDARQDEASDVADVAAVLYHMLAGRPPYRPGPRFANAHVDPLDSVAPWVTRALAQLVQDALLDPEGTGNGTMSAFRERLEAHGALRAPFTRDELGPTHEAARAGSTVTSVAARWIDDAEPSYAEDAELQREPVAGKYQLQHRLGSGGMGVVYAATGPGGERVAVKLIAARIGRVADAVHRLLREARAAGAIDHPNVVRILDSGTDRAHGRAWLAMELVEGGSLAALPRPLPPGPVVRLFLQVLAGLEAAHARDIVHRDVKPSNVLLHVGAGGVLTAKVSDFGLAKQVTASGTDDTTLDLTHSEGVLGSPRYMSPEQAKNAKRVDRRSDVWSVAVSLFASLTGERPWQQCTTVGEIIVAICTQDLPDMRALAPWLDPALVAVVMRGASRDPAQRFATAAAFAEALAPFADAAGTVTRDALRPLENVTAAAPVLAAAEGGEDTGGSAATEGVEARVRGDVAANQRRSRRALAVSVGGLAVAVLAAIIGTRLVTVGGPSDPAAPVGTAATVLDDATRPAAVAPPAVPDPPAPAEPSAAPVPPSAAPRVPSAAASGPRPSRPPATTTAPRAAMAVTTPASPAPASGAPAATSEPAAVVTTAAPAASTAAPAAPKPIDNW